MNSPPSSATDRPVIMNMEVITMAKKTRMPERKRCGALWPRFAVRICPDCESQLEFAHIVAAARPVREVPR